MNRTKQMVNGLICLIWLRRLKISSRIHILVRRLIWFNLIKVQKLINGTEPIHSLLSLIKYHLVPLYIRPTTFSVTCSPDFSSDYYRSLHLLSNCCFRFRDSWQVQQPIKVTNLNLNISKDRKENLVIIHFRFSSQLIQK